MGCEDTSSVGSGSAVDVSGLLQESETCYSPKPQDAIDRAKKLKGLLEAAGINAFGALGLAAVCIDESEIKPSMGKGTTAAQGIFQLIGMVRKQFLCMAKKSPDAKVYDMSMEEQVELIKAAVFYNGNIGSCGGYNDSHFGYMHRVFKTLNLCKSAEDGLYTAYCCVKNSGPGNAAWGKRAVTRDEYLKCFNVYNKSQTAAMASPNGPKKLASAMACAKDYAKKMMS